MDLFVNHTSVLFDKIKNDLHYVDMIPEWLQL